MAPGAGDDFDSLAEFMMENPEADAPQDAPVTDEGPNDELDNPDIDNPDDAPAEDEEEGDEPESDAPDKDAKPTSELKFKVPVKGEDGSESIIEVDQKELIAGYQRHSDYTRKTQALAQQREQAETQVNQSIEEGRKFYLTQAQIAQAAVRQIAGLKSQQELAVLAQTDPAAWVQENARAQYVDGLMQQMSHTAQQEQLQAQQAQQKQQAQAFQQAWGVLGQKGIDKVKLQGIFDAVTEQYEVPRERFANLYDPKLVLIMADAVAYRELKKKSETKTLEKVKAAPRLPPQRQSVPAEERVKQKIDNKFRNGTASLRDLARFV